MWVEKAASWFLSLSLSLSLVVLSVYSSGEALWPCFLVERDAMLIHALSMLLYELCETFGKLQYQNV